MIEDPDTTSGVQPADVVAGWMLQVQQLSVACADDGQRIDLLSALESLKGCAAAGQATVTVGFAATQTAEGLAAKTEPELIRRSVAGQVALARRDSQHRGGRHVGLAVALHTELPHTRKALEEGRISEWQATLICRETACLSPDLRRTADERLAPDLGALGDRMLERHAAKVTAELDAAAVADRSGKAAKDRKVTVRPAPDTMAYLTALLPASVAVAAYAALTSYTQLVVGEGDERGRGQIMADTLIDRLTGGMITGCDQHGAPIRKPNPEDAEQAAADQPVDAEPEGEQAADERTGDLAADGQAGEGPGGDNDNDKDAAEPDVEQATADEQRTDEQTGDEESAPGLDDEQAADGTDDPAAPVQAPAKAPDTNPGRYHFPTAADARATLAKVLPTAANIHLHVIMTDRTLFGVCDEPAELIGYGPIPAEVARALAATELGPKATTWIRRFYTDPITGQLAATEAKARRFPTVMREFLLVRDRACRTPYCHAPGRHDDHEHDHANGGPTSLINGQLTCEACNHTKQAPGWTVTTRADGIIETTTPTGHVYASPPPTPPGIEHLMPPGRIDTQLEHRLGKLILEYQAA